MKVKAVIIDDEKHAAETLQWEISRALPQIEVAAIFNDPLEALRELKLLNPDLVFLDIEMPQLNGIDLLRQLQPFEFSIIFTTAYDQFAIDALRMSAVDYLLKPVDKLELVAAFNRYENKKPGNDAQIQKKLLNNWSAIRLNRVSIPMGSGFELVQADEIIRCESDSNYCTLFFTDGRKEVLTKTLKELEAVLSGHGFVRVHASHIINFSHLVKFSKSDGGYVLLSDGTHITVSRSYKDNLLSLLDNS